MCNWYIHTSYSCIDGLSICTDFIELVEKLEEKENEEETEKLPFLSIFDISNCKSWHLCSLEDASPVH